MQTGTAYWTDMNTDMQWVKSEKKVVGEIMKTDVFVRVFAPEEVSRSEVNGDIVEALAMFRGFQLRYSRFLQESRLSEFNRSVGEVRITAEFADVLSRSLAFWKETEGIFNPSILPQLMREGYASAFGSVGFGKSDESIPLTDTALLGTLRVDKEKNLVEKPEGLQLDFGGIGKGYIVDRVGEFLGKKYEHFFIDAGGDICARGEDKDEERGFWAVDVELPEEVSSKQEPLLLLRDRSVATSGTSRRHWSGFTGEEKHHLIDPRTGQSAITDLFSVSVVDTETDHAEVWAKALCILGREAGMQKAREKKLAALFVGKDGQVTQSEYMEEYMWKGK